MLQIGRSLVRSQLVSLEFFIDIKSFRSHYGPGVDSASNEKWVPGAFLGGKGGRCVRLTTLSSSCAIVMKSGNLNFLELSGPLRASNGTTLPFYISENNSGFSPMEHLLDSMISVVIMRNLCESFIMFWVAVNRHVITFCHRHRGGWLQSQQAAVFIFSAIRTSNASLLFPFAYRFLFEVTFRGVIVFSTIPYGDYRNAFVFPYDLSSSISWSLFSAFSPTYAAPPPTHFSVPFLLSIFHLWIYPFH